MLLALDIGNTNVTIGLFRAGALIATRRAATDPRATPDEFEVVLDGLLRLDGITLADLDAIALASVVPAVSERGRGDRRSPRRAAARSPPPGPSRSRSGSIDRATSAPIGWSTRWPPPGSTAPRRSSSTSGPRPRSTAWPPTAPTSAAPSPLVSSWASRRSRPGPPSCRGSSCGRRTGPSAGTRSAPSSPGTIFGYQALVDGLLGRVRRELADANGVAPADVKAILTGGLSAAPWARDLDGLDAIDPDLTLKGLAILHAEVGGGEPLELGLR